MEIKDVLDQRTIITHFHAKDKQEVIEVLAGSFYKAGIVADKEQFVRDVYERERIGVTGIGNGIAIPHGRSESVTKPGIAIAVLEHEIAWESLDNTGAKIVILFAVGADNEGAMEHLKLLAMFSKRLGDNAVIQRLYKADDVQDVCDAFVEENAEDDNSSREEEELDFDEIQIM